MKNPYEPPAESHAVAPSADDSGYSPLVLHIASGHRYVLAAVAFQIVAVLAAPSRHGPATSAGDFSPLQSLLFLVSIALAWLGTDRVARGVAASSGKRWLLLLAVGCFSVFGLPLIYSEANKVLKASGCRLGLFGISRLPRADAR
jgi:hypothetical protein